MDKKNFKTRIRTRTRTRLRHGLGLEASAPRKQFQEMHFQISKDKTEQFIYSVYKNRKQS